jgi:very-short-patch-repair endonuclease
MKNFAKSVLNYFATYTETRFRFATRNLAYQWADDQQLAMDVLDLAVFPDVQARILDCVATNQPINVSLQQGEYAIPLNGRPLVQRLLDFTKRENGLEALEKDLRSHDFYAEERPAPPGGVATDLFELPISRQQKWLMACRRYNLRLRKEFSRRLLDLQQAKLNQLRATLHLVNAFPRVTLPARQEEQKFFNDIQELATKSSHPADYIAALQGHIEAAVKDFVLFDLFMVLSAYWQAVGPQAVYLFFHDIGSENQPRYPLFCAEIEISTDGDAMTLRSLRDVFMLNTPAVNSFEFDSVLTSPRACRFEEATPALRPIEQFLQAKYNVPNSFLLSHGFPSLVGENLPEVRFRVALQTVGDEDRRILDYSGLLTSLDAGAGRKFIDMVTQYVGGNVKDTSDDVARTYGQRYPRKSVDRLIHPSSQIPLPLNEPQKRILLAAENPNNRFIVVDGPPGTGKSHTITALIYQAALMGKSVLITSHKQQALDVIDNALIEQFRTVHPRAKPPVLRLTSVAAKGPRGPNDLENTLSAPVINAASQRYLAGNPDAVTKDRESLSVRIGADNDELWKNADTYPVLLRDTFELVRLHVELFGPEDDLGGASLSPPEPGYPVDCGRVVQIAGGMARVQCKIPLAALALLAERRHELAEALDRCNRLNASRATLGEELLALQQPIPDAIADFDRLLAELATACREDRPLPPANEGLPSILPDALCSLGEVRTYSDLCEVHDALQAIAAQEGKFLGRLRRDKQVEERRHALGRRFPSIARQLKKSSAAAIVGTYTEAVKRVDGTCDLIPWLKPNYLVSGHSGMLPTRLADLIRKIGDLEFHAVTALLASVCKGDLASVSLKESRTKLEGLRQVKDCQGLAASLDPIAKVAGIAIEDLPVLYVFLKTAAEILASVTNDDLTLLTHLFRVYGPVLALVGVSADDLRSLGTLTNRTGRPVQVLQYVELHDRVARRRDLRAPSRQAIAEFHAKTHKLLDHRMDGNFKGLQNFAGDVQKIIVAIKAGRRISDEQARVLFRSLACVIAEPGLISRYLPMTEDLVDYLIIDEASQVSIADSISLMLRAKQIIVFGDDLQYGAVGAINISERYAEQYFKDILRDYAADMNEALPEQERDDIAREVSRNPSEEDEESSQTYVVAPHTREWLKTFSVRTSTLSFAKALKNYSDSLNIHFRSFPEIISYSNEFFYRQSQIDLVPNRIRTKPIAEVLRFMPVETKGNSGRNVNLDEIEAVKVDLERLHAAGYKGTIGVICSFKEQTARMEELLRKELPFHTDLERDHRFRVWFVGDVQGEERDLVYYSLVQDKRLDNADLVAIYPKVGGTADNIRRLKMQRLNVGFSRARDTMVFVHSMPIADYSDTRLGDALKHYANIRAATHDVYVTDETVFGSPAEKKLYSLIIQTDFFRAHRDRIRLIAQFEIGKYIRQEYHRFMPPYRVDFLMTLGGNGKEKSLIIEYDGVEFHTRNPEFVTAHNFDQEYLEYDVQRQLELESFGYTFLRINKFSLLPRRQGQSPADALSGMLERAFA